MSTRRSRRGKSIVKQRQERNRRLIIIGVVIVVVVIGAFLLISQLLPVDVPLPDGYEEKYAGLQQGTTAEGYPQLGDPNAPIEVKEYSSFTCPACNQLHDTVIDRILNYVEDGDVRIVYVPISNIGGQGADETARAGYCALKQDFFWEMHDIMFYWQERVNPSERRLRAAAEEVGLDTDAFNDCLDSGDTRDQVQGGLSEFRSRGLNSTPRVFLNGQELDNWSSLPSELDALVSSAE